MNARTLSNLTTLSAAAVVFDLYPFSSLLGFTITVALGMMAYRAIDEEVSRQYTESLTKNPPRSQQ